MTPPNRTLVIAVDSIDEPRQPFERELDPAAVAEALGGDSPYTPRGSSRLLVHLTRLSGRDVLLEGRTEVHLTSACRRCLVEVQGDVPVLFTLSLVAASKSSGRKIPADDSGDGERSASFDDREADEEPFDGERIDLGPIFREQILLGLPGIEPLCRPECKGLCATCGQDLNDRDCGHRAVGPDPRWAGLEKFKV